MTESPTSKPVIKRFRKAFNGPRLTPEQAARQGGIARMAWERLGGQDAAKAFLNHHDEELGGRPLDIATASAEGFSSVEHAIGRRS